MHIQSFHSWCMFFRYLFAHMQKMLELNTHGVVKYSIKRIGRWKLGPSGKLRLFLYIMVFTLMHSQFETWYLEFSLTSEGLNLTETKIFSFCPFVFQCSGSSPPISPISYSPLFSSQIQSPIHSKTINRGPHDFVINKYKSPPPHSNP